MTHLERKSSLKRINKSFANPDIIQKLLNLGFREIQREEESLFRKYFKRYRQTSAYSNSWLYITQAARGLGELGYYYESEKKDFIVALGLHPNKKNFVLINPLGKLSSEIFLTLEELCTVSSHPVYLKKMSKTKRKKLPGYLKATNLQLETTETYPWKEGEENDDDTFPEIVTDINRLVNIVYNENISNLKDLKERKQIKSFRTKLNYCKEIASEFEYLPVSQVSEDKIFEMIKNHFKPDTVFADAYKNMLNILHNKGINDSQYVDFIAVNKGTPLGFFAAEKLTSESAGLYASIASRGYRGLSETLHFYLFRKLLDQGIKCLNLGVQRLKAFMNSNSDSDLPVMKIAFIN